MQQMDLLMTSDQKKAFLLLKSILFQYHGLDKEERQSLREAAEALDAVPEFAWVTDFVSSDVYTAFERTRSYLSSLTELWDNDTKLNSLAMLWQATNQKGYITEMEATTMLKVAKDWKIQRELMMMVRKK